MLCDSAVPRLFGFRCSKAAAGSKLASGESNPIDDTTLAIDSVGDVSPCGKLPGDRGVPEGNVTEVLLHQLEPHTDGSAAGGAGGVGAGSHKWGVVSPHPMGRCGGLGAQRSASQCIVGVLTSGAPHWLLVAIPTGALLDAVPFQGDAKSPGVGLGVDHGE